MSITAIIFSYILCELLCSCCRLLWCLLRLPVDGERTINSWVIFSDFCNVRNWSSQWQSRKLLYYIIVEIEHCIERIFCWAFIMVFVTISIYEELLWQALDCRSLPFGRTREPFAVFYWSKAESAVHAVTKTNKASSTASSNTVLVDKHRVEPSILRLTRKDDHQNRESRRIEKSLVKARNLHWKTPFKLSNRSAVQVLKRIEKAETPFAKTSQKSPR